MLLQIGPDGVVATLETGWPRRRRVSASSVSAGKPPLEPSGEGTAAALDADALQAVFDEIELVLPLRGTRLVVEVADPLIHFDVAEGDFGALADRQLQAIAAACMGELLGDAAADHEVRWSMQAGERHLVIAALPRALIAALAAAADLRGLRLASVQPGFARRWNAFARGLDAPTAVFASTSGPHAVVSCVVERALCAVSSGPWRDSGETAPGRSPRATATAALSLLDERAARLLAGIGIETTIAPAYLLVSADAAAGAAPSRWTVVAPPTEVAA